jgi:hypothetical protein
MGWSFGRDRKKTKAPCHSRCGTRISIIGHGDHLVSLFSKQITKYCKLDVQQKNDQNVFYWSIQLILLPVFFREYVVQNLHNSEISRTAWNFWVLSYIAKL